MKTSALEFQQIYEDFQPKILRYLTRMAGTSEAEDLTQEVFIKVNEALPDFRGESKLSTWLYRIATNAAMDRIRTWSYRRTAQESSCFVSEDGPQIEDKNMWTGEEKPLVEHEIFRKEMNDCIRGFIEKLPEDYRTVLVLSEFEGLKNSEIADILGLKLHTVKIRLHRARERLKEEFIKNCDSYWIDDNEFIPELKAL
jgi:RNA polymerase sigma-70 factor (ECF subfamily)